MIELQNQRIELTEVRTEIDWHRLIRKELKILFITDGSVTETNSVYKYMKNKLLGCTILRIDRALYREGGVLRVTEEPQDDSTPHYQNFQFRSTVPNSEKLIIDDYDVIFIFAVASGTSIPEDELRIIHTWMNSGGGVFATGDHETLGERMCTKIPRVGTMRKWSTADDVPPGGSEKRIDTNQPDPLNADQLAGRESIPNLAQSDATPQPIHWLSQRIEFHGTRRIDYPHEILCHPTLGPINVMPDHPHEGECVTVSKLKLSAEVEFEFEFEGDEDETEKKKKKDEYPTSAGGHQEKPVVIATGQTSSRYSLAKGDVEAKEFNMISVYDGHRSGVGRVVVDSTWHHWYGMNIDDLMAAGGSNWEKIGRYFLNIAKYLSPPGVFRQNCWFDIVDTQFSYPFNEEQLLTGVSEDLLTSGSVLEEGLRLRWGACGVDSFIMVNICDLKPQLCELIEKEILRPVDPLRPRRPLITPRDIPGLPDSVCLTCPPFDVLRKVALGGIVRGTAPVREQLYASFYEGKPLSGSLGTEEIEQLAKEGMKQALDEFSSGLVLDLKRSAEVWAEM
ncbi:MAG: hypothetical protein AAF171_01920 [Cyanobacteria bacterium P01_A01_bin.116]